MQVYISPSNQNAQILSNLLRFSPPLSQPVNKMLFKAALSLLLSLGSSLVAASPISGGVNATALIRACGSVPSKEFVDQAEAHFAKHKVTTKSEVGIAVASIPVYCAPDLASLWFRRGWADTRSFHRACDLQDHFPVWWIYP